MRAASALALSGPDSGNRLQASAFRAVSMPSFDLLFQLIHLSIQLLETSVQTRKQLTAGAQQAVLSIRQDLRHPPLEATGSLRHHNPELGQ